MGSPIPWSTAWAPLPLSWYRVHSGRQSVDLHLVRIIMYCFQLCLSIWKHEKWNIMPSVLTYHHQNNDSPLSNEFLISLTSTCEPGTRNIPCCCNPKSTETQPRFQGFRVTLPLSPKLHASFMKPEWKHITQSRKCNLVIKADEVFFQERAPHWGCSIWF